MKKFFEKKKLDYKFKKAGAGHRLDEENPRPAPQPAKTQPEPQHPPSESSRAAGGAAITRLEGSGEPGGKTATSKKSTASHGPALRKERSLESQSQAAAVALPPQQTVTVLDIASSTLVVHVVCPLCQRSVPHTSSQGHLTTCLQEEYLKEPLTSSVHMIHTLCKDQEKKRLCIDTLCRYLNNIIDHPEEEKYRKIRTNNKAFKERVSTVEGAVLFLEALGFSQQLLPHQDGEEQFYVLPGEEGVSSEHVVVGRELLTSTQPLKTTVDRNLQVFQPSSRVTHFDLPQEFFHLTVDEIRREQKLRTEVVERESVLRTKAMREKDEMRMAIRHYRFLLLRIRLPDGLILQGVFRPMERLSDVRIFISDAVVDPSLTFSLSALGKPLTDDTNTLAQLGLAPSAVLNLSWDQQQVSHSLLKAELLARVQEFV